MNLSKPLHTASQVLHNFLLRCRAVLPRKRCFAFAEPINSGGSGIGEIYVINLDRQADRWADVLRELASIPDAAGKPLADRAIRYSASDAQAATYNDTDFSDINPFYTLGDQLYVEPQPHALPDEFDLVRLIRMSQEEVAVARSHIGVWKTVARSAARYVLVVEDDVWFERGFSSTLDHAWREMKEADKSDPAFDLLYVSYGEVRYGAPKELISEHVFRPERGLWFLSGYVLSKKGALALLQQLPCTGPIDLWINHKYHAIDVRALRRSVVHQRADLLSTNSYSILPALTKIGVLDHSDASLFHQRRLHSPVFAFGAPASGLSSLAMALSMLGYSCCSDLDQLPESEFEKLITGRGRTTFNAYVNVGSLRPHLPTLMLRYPQAKFIVTVSDQAADRSSDVVREALQGAEVACLHTSDVNPWRTLCEHLKLSPPAAQFPVMHDLGQRKLRGASVGTSKSRRASQRRYDRSPWVAKRRTRWEGISIPKSENTEPFEPRNTFEDNFVDIRLERWLVRSDTFPGNRGLFRPANVSAQLEGGLSLTVREEPLGIRDMSAAAISSRDRFLFGRFETTMQAADVSGVVTGFFLHRSSPRQEIDIEIAGNRPEQLIVNVFYNPGSEGSKFDYGYRGTPAVIQLGFDASKAPHRYAIEWDPFEIRWLVDGELIHRRAEWNPTPIPHLPMTLHCNTWPARSRELAGRLALRALPASATVRSIAVDAFNAGVSP